MPETYSARGRALPLILVTVAIVFAVAGYLVARSGSPPRPEQAASRGPLLLYPQPRVIADFALVDKQGEPYALERWKGAASLVFFGFTHCPDICPGTLGLLSAVSAELEARGFDRDRLQLHFISVDPERDSPQMLARYVDFFDPQMQAATGPHAQLAALTRQLGILYSIQDHEPDSRAYSVDHSASVLLIDADGRLAGAFPAPHDADAMVESLAGWLAAAP